MAIAISSSISPAWAQTSVLPDNDAPAASSAPNTRNLSPFHVPTASPSGSGSGVLTNAIGGSGSTGSVSSGNTANGGVSASSGLAGMLSAARSQFNAIGQHDGGNAATSAAQTKASSANLPPIFAASGNGSGDNSGGNNSGMPAAGALPSVPDATPRSPGMELPANAGASNAFSNSSNGAAAPVKTPEQTEADIRDQAFGAAITGLIPLKPAEIRQVLERYDETRQAVETPIYPYPKPELTAQTISLDPGSVPAEIKVAVGQVTTLNIIDITGQPWPIQDISWAGNFEIVQPEEGSNVVRITPLSDFTYGNISMRLLKLKTPVTFTMRTHRDVVQYRFDARIPDNGPYAQSPLIEGSGPSMAAGDSTQNAILDGIPPSNAEKLKVTGVDSRTTAYKVSSLTYVRTPLTLLSPGWSSSVSSADGMSVYTMGDTPVLLLSDKGNVIQAHLANKDDWVKNQIGDNGSTDTASDTPNNAPASKSMTNE